MNPISLSRRVLVLLLSAITSISAQTPAAHLANAGKKTTPPKHANKGVRLGISVSKPSNAIYAQLPKLPQGCGFLLQSVSDGGTAAAAGLKPMDVIWKLDDQILVNENQLMVLLSHHRPGDKIKLSYFHAGLEKETTLVLKAGNATPASPAEIAMTPPFPGAPGFPPESGASALPMRVISYEDRSASISDKHGTATLTYREGKPWLQVESDRGIETFNGPVSNTADVARVPIAWRGRLPILQRSLEESIRLRKLPRVRRVPTPKQRVAGSNELR